MSRLINVVTGDPGIPSESWAEITDVESVVKRAESLARAGGIGISTSEIITQASHGFIIGNVLRLSGNVYIKALADSSANAEVIGMVSVINTGGIFTLTLFGKITGLTGLTPGAVYFLSPTSAGDFTTVEPSTPGQISKPVLIADSTTSGFVINMRGVTI